MGSITTGEAALLGYCEVLPSRFDTLIPDGFWPLIDFEEIDAGCVSNAVIANADKPTPQFTSSGGGISTTPVGYSASIGEGFSRIVARIELGGGLATNLSDVNDVLEDQTTALAALVQEKAAAELWASTPSTNAPQGMAHFASVLVNPVGPLSPVAGEGTPLTPNELRRQRLFMSPWSPGSSLYHVMHTQLYMTLHDMAWNAGSPLDYREDPRSGAFVPYFDGVPVIATDHIQLDEGGTGNTSMYLVRVGDAPNEHVKIRGFRGYTPADAPGIRITTMRPDDGANDMVFAEVEFNLAWQPGSRSSVLRTKGIAP